MEYEYPFKEASEALMQLVWEKGEIIPHYSPTIWRWDKYGKVMKYKEHGNIESKFGWEIDHIYPRELGGSDDVYNLQPLQWKNNRAKSDSLNWDSTCKNESGSYINNFRNLIKKAVSR